jgi:hypothetical protein
VSQLVVHIPECIYNFKIVPVAETKVETGVIFSSLIQKTSDEIKTDDPTTIGMTSKPIVSTIPLQ